MANDNNTVSIIIPVYNREEFITECLDSVFAQTYKNFECIVVNDGSTDNTIKKLENYPHKITIINKTNQGPSSARNAGIKIAKGKQITFLDSDDLWLPKKLEKQIEIFNFNPEIKISYTEEIWYRKGIRVNPHKKHQKYSGNIYKHCIPLCIISPSSVMIEHTVFNDIGLFDEDLPACEDYDLWLRIAAKHPVLLIKDKLIIKRNGHDGQQSAKFWGMDKFRIKALLKMLTTGNLNEPDHKLTLETFRKKCSILINGAKKRKKLEDIKYYQNILNSIQDNKTNEKPQQSTY